MKSTRARFKQSLRYCKSNENRARADALANQLLLKDNINFWKHVNKMNRIGHNVLASTINGVTGENNIVNMWCEHYKKLLNSNCDSSNKHYVESAINTGINSDSTFCKFNTHEILNAIDKLKVGKSAGTDSLQGEHFIFADPKVACLLYMLFNVMFVHTYLPTKLMETIIVPIIKDKKGLVTDKDNYRPIAVTSVLSKIMELALLERIQRSTWYCM